MKLITTQYAGQCVSCDEDYDVGERVYWEKGLGCWHEECAAPKDLKSHQKGITERQKLGLEPLPFGSAPMLKERK